MSRSCHVLTCSQIVSIYLIYLVQKFNSYDGTTEENNNLQLQKLKYSNYFYDELQ